MDLSARNKKIISVALATLSLCAVQLGFSLAITFTATCLITATTYLSEKYIRTEAHQQSDWFNTDCDKKELAITGIVFYLVPLVIQIAGLIFGIPAPIPQEGIVQMILSRPWTMLGIAGFHAPIVEEILFRGFLFERCEDVTHLLNRHNIIQLSRSTQQTISNIAQGILFGMIHLNRAIKEGYQLFVVSAISVMGVVAGKLKQKKRTLIWPIALHSAQNLRFVTYVLIRGASSSLFK